VGWGGGGGGGWVGGGGGGGGETFVSLMEPASWDRVREKWASRDGMGTGPNLSLS